jgi:cytochrome c553
LAGQKPLYIVSQLWDFAYHTRDNPFSRQYMWCAVANHLSLQTVRDLAVYVTMLHAKPANNGSAALVPSGQKLYREGLPTANIPACVACHGPNAEGSGSIPRLGGLSYYYLKRRLEQWGEGYHASAAFPMPQVASKLPADEIEVLASYLSFVN